VQDETVAPLKQISNPPPFVPLKNRIKLGVIETGDPFSSYVKSEKTKENPPMPKSVTAGLMAASKENDQVSFGAEKAGVKTVGSELAVSEENVPLSV